MASMRPPGAQGHSTVTLGEVSMRFVMVTRMRGSVLSTASTLEEMNLSHRIWPTSHHVFIISGYKENLFQPDSRTRSSSCTPPPLPRRSSRIVSVPQTYLERRGPTFTTQTFRTHPSIDVLNVGKYTIDTSQSRATGRGQITACFCDAP